MLRVEQDDEAVLEQCQLSGVATPAFLASIAVLLNGDYGKTRIYDVKRGVSMETRRVTIWVQSHPGYQTVCNINVSRENPKGDGWTRWKVRKIRIQFIFQETNEIDRDYTLKRYVSGHGSEELSREVYKNIGALLFVVT